MLESKPFAREARTGEIIANVLLAALAAFFVYGYLGPFVGIR